VTTLRFDDIRKTFGTTVALEEFSLDVREGELVSLLGPSGCGKTTALRVAAGFETGDRGSVHLSGNEITRVPAHKRNMGMVFQSYSLFPNLSVAQNVEFGLRTRKVRTEERRRRTMAVLDLVQLASLADRYPHQLSGGQQQRVALARALAIEPAVLLLDEPLSALDAKVRTTLRDEIRRIQTEIGTTTLFVTHDQEEALTISDRIAVMSEGRIEQLGTPMQIYRQPSSGFVARFIGSLNEIPAISKGPGRIEVAGRDYAVDHTHPIGASLSLLIRPEDTRLDPTGFAGTVVNSHFQGAATRIVVRVDTIDSLVEVHGVGDDLTSLQPGARTAVDFERSRAVCEARSI
jgi:putative spermidine/putrescine transport system ATP-binding protein